MPRGRKPKPTTLKLLEGNRGRRPLPENEPAFTEGIPDPPSHLEGEALAEWKRITVELRANRMMTMVDGAALAAYCTAFARWIHAERELRKTGMVIKSPSGYPIQNPYLGIANTAMNAMHKFLTEFGMTPSSRVRTLGTRDAAQQPGDDLVGWLNSQIERRADAKERAQKAASTNRRKKKTPSKKTKKRPKAD